MPLRWPRARSSDGEHFVLNGRKLWITNAAEAGIFCSVRQRQSGRRVTAASRAFVIERGFPGFQVGKKEDKLGIRASSTCELILDDCRVPAIMSWAKLARVIRSRSRR